MLRRRLYFILKPYLPLRLRVALRRISAAWRRRIFRASWPIDQAAAQPPKGWPGWPEGKSFAFILTHDVEGPDGLGKCRQLAELELSHGFRSCFNLIPEGPYAVPPELRAWLAAQGFETGVHDLHHNGALFSSRGGFRAKARRINLYLKEWGASGFRSGFMLHELDWLHDLDIKYDCSTFDTDPFEPQPDGTGTIFPFWVAAPNASAQKRGYVELPYTLPQDSTLFLILKESSPEIWLRKLDWIAEHGGMALVNVHPDYLNFPGEGKNAHQYPADFYGKLLRHVAEAHAGRFWAPTPGQLAQWFTDIVAANQTSCASSLDADCRETPPNAVPLHLKGKRAAVILYSNYPADPRPRRAAESMVNAGMSVDLLCLAQDGGEPRHEWVGGVHVFRVPMKHRRDGKWTYLWQYGRFFISALWFLTHRGLRRRYDIVHIHNMPDALVFAAALPKLRGAKIILDLHDPMPELMMTIFDVGENHWEIRLLKTIERLSLRFVDLALTPNVAFKRLFVSRSCPPEKMQIVMNSPQQEIFAPAKDPPIRSASMRGFRLMHHGLIAHRHGIDTLVEALARARSRVPGIQLSIYGSPTPYLEIVFALAKRLQVDDILHFHGAKPQAAIAVAIAESDLGVIPNRRSAFTELNFPTRLFEYLAMGRPVIAPATRGIQDYFGPEQMLFFEPDSPGSLADQIVWVYNHPQATAGYIQRGREIYNRHLWSTEEVRYLSLLQDLAASGSRAVPPPADIDRDPRQ